MSLYAMVRCLCYEQGLCTEPPFALDVYTDDNGFPALGLPENEHTRDHFAHFGEWLRYACEHPNMRYIDVRITSRAGYLNFLGGLDSFGREKLPTVFQSLPWLQRQMRPTRPEKARKVLMELEHFREKADFGLNSFIVDSANGTIVNEYHPDPHGSLHTILEDGRNRTRIAFNARGIYVIQKPEGARRNRVVFQAKRLEQRLLEPVSTTLEHERKVEYTNLNTGRKFVCSTPISKAVWGDDAKIHLTYPRYLHVEERLRDGAYFDYVLEPLTEVLRTAVEVGNPVIWYEG